MSNVPANDHVCPCGSCCCRCHYHCRRATPASALPLQVGAAGVALHIPGKAMHMRALCGGLASVRNSLIYVKSMLEDSDMEWGIVQDTVARELTKSSMFLGGVLDGCVIAALPSRSNGFDAAPTRAMSFKGTMFQDEILRGIQDDIIDLRSFASEGQEEQADLWTVINFWKHYFPYKPLPQSFTRSRRDFQLVLGGDPAERDPSPNPSNRHLSGPVVHDLLIPAFNAACRITDRLLEMYRVPGDHSVSPITSY